MAKQHASSPKKPIHRQTSVSSVVLSFRIVGSFGSGYSFVLRISQNIRDIRAIRGSASCPVICVHSWLMDPSSAGSVGEQLSFRFEPIRFGVARQSKSAASLGNEIRAQTNLFVRGLRWSSRVWRGGTLCSLRSRNLFIAHARLLSVCCCAARPRRFTGVHFCGRSGSFW